MTAIPRLLVFHINVFLCGIVLSTFGIVIGAYIGVKLSYSLFGIMCLKLIGYAGSLLVQAILYYQFYRPILEHREVVFLKWTVVAGSAFAAAWLLVGWFADGEVSGDKLAVATAALLPTILPLNAATVLPAHLSSERHRKRSADLN